ncbi:ABC transporter substrate-binding protein [Gelidibacter salicanalis]|uniref:ABC transporter substrate-binding protein n=1 Tax=Gelidibacter salicanalis TaxID=291193 RepID=A0A934KMA9_9FLAO|nr:ABC transporter substrate-binding protein [Gelidibacter salicanalis]MBJ7881827.1 ABC transporter substrate-binding protein [Gelidibacter salicanalis]
MKKIKSIPNAFIVLIGFLIFFSGCESGKVQELNIGYIGPLSVRATDLGIDPSNAMLLAVEEYNSNRLQDEPKVNLYIEDDKWDEANAIPAYKKLRQEHDISIVFISNTDGTVLVQDEILKDHVILINPLNNGELFRSLNKNSFNIAKSTEQTNGLVANRIIELGLKKVALFQFPNDYMTNATREVKRLLDLSEVELNIIPVKANQTTFIDHLKQLKEDDYDAYVFFGYKEFGFGMKEARDMGITAPFFASTVLLDPEFYLNSEGTVIGSEFPFFTPTDGNFTLAEEFLTKYEKRFDHSPSSVWPPMQAYDAMNLILSKVKAINNSKDKHTDFDDWLREALLEVNYYQGVCGNIAISRSGASKGIYFSLYKYGSKENPIEKIKR